MVAGPSDEDAALLSAMTATEGRAMRLPRGSGILLHVTSLPSRFGIGDLGPHALEFVKFLAETGQRWWQLLPLGPTGYGNSPYQSYSSFAGNPLLISPESLADEGLLSASDLAGTGPFPEDRVDFETVVPAKFRLLRRAFEAFSPAPAEFDEMVERNASWLDDYALFTALKEHHGGRPWYEWGPRLVRRDPEALNRAREELKDSVRFVRFQQYVFAKQWEAVRQACRARGVSLFGDVPIFVSKDSADVWSRPDLFWLDGRGRPTVVAGVPPDAFAKTGQLWGNPIYRWEVHAREGYAWWIARLRAQTDRVDLVRLDHFRGFQAYWEVPATARTARKGRYVEGPGAAFLEAIRAALGRLPIVAEDLGDIDAPVYALRDQFDLPGMRVLQFGLGGEEGSAFHLPFTYGEHCVAYTGTHDNDTTVGWFDELPPADRGERAYHQAQRAHGRRFLDTPRGAPHWQAIRAVMASVADTVIVPLQDVLGLGQEGRMNVPGRADGNWTWRFVDRQLGQKVRDRLAESTVVQGRWNGPVPEALAPPRREATVRRRARRAG